MHTERRLSGPYLEKLEAETKWYEAPMLATAERLQLRFDRHGKSLDRLASAILASAPEVARLSDDAIRERALRLGPALLRDGYADGLVSEAFGLIREASGRTIGKRHYKVQLVGGLALVRGMIAEMQTGEGKTITAALAAVTAALTGIPVHVITVNDYLAERDADLLRPLYEFFGLTLGALVHGQDRDERRAVYRADIVYGANKEIAFDYLRDRIELGRNKARGPSVVSRLERPSDQPLDIVLRGLGFAIVDEADSVLIDEARTPLIISYPSQDPGNSDIYPAALKVAQSLIEHEDYTLVPALKDVTLTDQGKEKIELGLVARGGVWAIRRARESLVRSALSALHLYKREKHYVVREGKVEMVDEFTGRIAEGRSWQGGLQQLMEAKEGCAFSDQRETRARITYQRFFQRYARLSGMSGTVSELAGELRAVYGVSVVRVPPNRPNRRRDLGSTAVLTAADKWRAVNAAVRKINQTGRPVLVGTQSIEESVELSAMLSADGIEHVVLNAHQDKNEAEIVARSGEPGRVTVATNMAGRGTDVQLAPGVADMGGLHVILTGYHESARIDRQLIGRGGRQGDPSSFEAIVSLEDELFRRFSPYSRGVAAAVASQTRSFGNRLTQTLRRRAQSAAERYNLGQRKATLESERNLRRSLAFTGAPD